MELWLIILCVLLFVVLSAIYYKKQVVKKREEYHFLIEQVDEIKKLNEHEVARRTGLEKENAGLKNQNDYLQGQIDQNQQRLNKMISDGNQTARAAVDAFAEEYKKNKLQQVNEQLNEFEANAQLRKIALNEELLPLIKEVDEYTKKREAIIEAQKREIELRDAQEFHKVQLTTVVVEDIKYINSILGRLSKPEIVAKVVWEAYIQGPTKEMLNRIIGKDKKTGIYRITNIDTQECYIGQGVDVGKRLTEHIKGTLGIQSIADQKIHHAMADSGLQNWTFELLEECERDELNNREKFYISYYRSNEFGYNKTVGG
jgi:hypothetical protein